MSILSPLSKRNVRPQYCNNTIVKSPLVRYRELFELVSGEEVIFNLDDFGGGQFTFVKEDLGDCRVGLPRLSWCSLRARHEPFFRVSNR